MRRDTLVNLNANDSEDEIDPKLSTLRSIPLNAEYRLT